MDTAIILNSLIYALLGVVIFITSFIIVDKLTPYDLWKQLERVQAERDALDNIAPKPKQTTE